MGCGSRSVRGSREYAGSAILTSAGEEYEGGDNEGTFFLKMKDFYVYVIIFAQIKAFLGGLGTKPPGAGW